MLGEKPEVQSVFNYIPEKVRGDEVRDLGKTFNSNCNASWNSLCAQGCWH